MRKITIIAAVFAFTVMSALSSASAGEQKKFVYLPQNLNNPFYTTIADTFADEYGKEGHLFTPLDPNNDQAVQISLMEDAIAQGVSAIFVTPVTTDGIISGLLNAKENGIPVVAIDCTMEKGDEHLVVSTVTTDNYNCGFLTAKQFIKDFPNGAKIAVIDCPLYTACVDREQGFKDGLAEKKDLFEIVAQQNGNAALEPSMRVAENMLQANPDIQAFFGINDPTALGIIAVLKAADRVGQVKVYGVDGSPDAKLAIKEGSMRTTAAQSPVNMAKLTKEVTEKYMKGEGTDNLTLIPTFLIDETNVDTYGTDGWQ